MVKSGLRTGLGILLLGAATLGAAGCGESTPSGPAPYQAKEMIVVAVKDTINGIYTDRVMTIDPKDSLNMTPRYLLDSIRLVTSPSAGKMTYLLEQQGDGDDFKIFIADIDGRNRRQIAGTDALERAIAFPVLSPDARKVVYSTLDNRLVMQNIDGTGAEVLSTNAAFETIPDFDADGDRIAFYGDDESLYVINTDGTGLRKVADSAKSDPEGQSKVEWSPDGSKLVYVGMDGRGQTDIYVVNADGSGKQQLTDDLSNDLVPTWSPDGAQIAWTGFPGDVFVMNADGSNRRNITPNVSNIDTYPEWAPDGKRLIFVNHYPGVEVGTLRMYDFRSGETRSIAFKVTRGFWGKF